MNPLPCPFKQDAPPPLLAPEEFLRSLTEYNTVNHFCLCNSAVSSRLSDPKREPEVSLPLQGPQQDLLLLFFADWPLPCYTYGNTLQTLV